MVKYWRAEVPQHPGADAPRLASTFAVAGAIVFNFNPTPTPYDLRWEMFRTPVRVHPTFWLFSAIFGWSTITLGIGVLLLWIACTFVSILVHELGHVLAARLFGRPSQIVLYALGGVAIGPYQTVARWQRILISFGGPAAGFLLYGIVWLMGSQVDVGGLERNQRLYVTLLFEFLLFMNLFWNVLNLLPVQPLDGGQISRELCQAVSRRRGVHFSLGLSFLCAGLLAVYSVIVMVRAELWHPFDPKFSAIFFALLAVQSYIMMQQERDMQRHWDLDDHWR